MAVAATTWILPRRNFRVRYKRAAPKSAVGGSAALLAHPSEAARRGVAGRARVESSFRVEDQMERLLRIFESVVAA
jgi:hypothetical protein